MILFDTNILVYLYDPREPDKQARARQVLPALQARRVGCFTVQVLAEFLHLAPRKLLMSRADAYTQIAAIIQIWPILDLTPAIVLEAARGARDHSLAYYDAQIWAAAKLHQIPAIFSEDFNSGASLEGVRFVNPFAPAFRLDDWV
jgi:predicted nucleic acid-binding protein